MELSVSLEEDAVQLRMRFDTFFHAHFERVTRAAALVTRDAALGQDLAQSVHATARTVERSPSATRTGAIR